MANINYDVAYVGIGYGIKGEVLNYVKVWVDTREVLALIRAVQKGHRFFAIEPRLDAQGVQESFSHTASYAAAMGRDVSDEDIDEEMSHLSGAQRNRYISANHCQAGSTMVIYDIKILFEDESQREAFNEDTSTSGIREGFPYMEEKALDYAGKNPVEVHSRKWTWDFDARKES